MMRFDPEVLCKKLRRWEKYLYNYSLPAWHDIPNIGLYMEQTVTLLSDYLDYMPPEIKNGHVITPATVNNYVRMRVMPEPVKKRYFRVHIAYLIIICSLKNSLSIAEISSLLPADMSEDELKDFYDRFRTVQTNAARYFIAQVREQSESILTKAPDAADNASELILKAAIVGGFSRLLSEKMMLLSDLTPDSPGIDLTVPERR